VSERDRKINCAQHGPGHATYVCTHLRGGVACGHHASQRSDDDPWPDAWCDACEDVLEREGEWNDRSEQHADIQLLCHRCYEHVRTLNRELPLPLAPGELQVTGARFEALLAAALTYTERCQDRAEHEFHMLRYERWYWNGDRRELTFHDEPATHELVADADVIGSYSLNTRTWLWVWDNDNYAPEAKRRISPVAVFGEVRGIEKLSDSCWAAGETDGWEMAALANYLLGGQAIYRAPMDHLYVFLLLDKLRWRAPRAQEPPSPESSAARTRS
jgi:hypothetical protein